MVVLGWILKGLVLLFMVVGSGALLNLVAKAFLGVDDWSDLSSRKRKDSPVAGQWTFTIHNSFNRTGSAR